MNFEDRPLCFDCDGDSLVGVVSIPERAADIGVLVVVGGPQYRVGSHRQFVELSRGLASHGYPVLRFDVRGMGDSEGGARDFRDIDADIQAAMAALTAASGASRVVLWGLCDGASACLMYVRRRRDAAVAGLVLLNPWVRSEVSLARTHVKHYYGSRLRQLSFWRKLLVGGVAVTALRDLLRSVVASRRGVDGSEGEAFQAVMAEGWRRFAGPILVILSSEDYVAKEFVEACASDERWRRAIVDKAAETHRVEGADHTFSSRAGKLAVETAMLDWLRRCPANPRP